MGLFSRRPDFDEHSIYTHKVSKYKKDNALTYTMINVTNACINMIQTFI